MPAFVAVSGFLAYNKVGYLPFFKYIKKRFMQLMLPFLSWTVLFFLCRGKLSHVELANSIVHPDSAYWFLYTLFFICCIFELCIILSRLFKIADYVPLIIVSLTLMLIMVFVNIKVFGYQLISYYFFFYCLGYLIRKFDWLIENNYMVILISVIWLIMAFFWRIDEKPIYMYSFGFFPETLLLYCNRFLTAIVGVFALFSLSAKCLVKVNNKCILWIGFYSLGIYTAQLLYSHLITEPIYQFLGQSTDFSKIIIVFIAISILSTITIKICANYKITSKYLLGKI